MKVKVINSKKHIYSVKCTVYFNDSTITKFQGGLGSKRIPTIFIDEIDVHFKHIQCDGESRKYVGVYDIHWKELDMSYIEKYLNDVYGINQCDITSDNIRRDGGKFPIPYKIKIDRTKEEYLKIKSVAQRQIKLKRIIGV